MLAMLQSGLDVRGVMTHRFGVDVLDLGFEAMRLDACGKAVLDWRYARTLAAERERSATATREP